MFAEIYRARQMRAELPDESQDLFDEALRRYVRVQRKVKSGKTSWQTLAAFEQKILTETKKMFTTAAKQGHAVVQFSLGSVYLNGEGVAQDYTEAARWLRKAAEKGIAAAQYSLGQMYRDGEGFTQDSKEAIRWFRKAAGQGGEGSVHGEFSLALMYIRGEGVPRDMPEGRRWLQEAADHGHVDARSMFAEICRAREARGAS
jgi:TPR repeat protein